MIIIITLLGREIEKETILGLDIEKEKLSEQSIRMTSIKIFISLIRNVYNLYLHGSIACTELLKCQIFNSSFPANSTT